jgi:hypothetical protein
MRTEDKNEIVNELEALLKEAKEEAEYTKKKRPEFYPNYTGRVIGLMEALEVVKGERE